MDKRWRSGGWRWMAVDGGGEAVREVEKRWRNGGEAVEEPPSVQ